MYAYKVSFCFVGHYLFVEMWDSSTRPTVLTPWDFNWYILLLQTLLWIGPTTLSGGRVRTSGWTRQDGPWISTTSMRTPSFILLQCTKHCESNCPTWDMWTVRWTSVSKPSMPVLECVETWVSDTLKNFHFANLWTQSTYDKITRYVTVFLQVKYHHFSIHPFFLLHESKLADYETTHHNLFIYHF